MPSRTTRPAGSGSCPRAGTSAATITDPTRKLATISRRRPSRSDSRPLAKLATAAVGDDNRNSRPTDAGDQPRPRTANTPSSTQKVENERL